MTKFRNTELKKLCWQAGSTPTEQEFHECMEQIRGVNESAFLYLNEIPVEMWALSYDDDKRYDILTTNLSESFNNVLKGCRTLPITALVKATFDKVVQLFADRRNVGIMWHQAGFLYPQNIWKDVLERSQRRYHTTIVPHNRFLRQFHIRQYTLNAPLAGTDNHDNRSNIVAGALTLWVDIQHNIYFLDYYQHMSLEATNRYRKWYKKHGMTRVQNPSHNVPMTGYTPTTHNWGIVKQGVHDVYQLLANRASFEDCQK
ncbi:unnamed protein product [Cuscuta europaea]|uniref:Uncharacterized protein n=1 Tax=Cuscuta europaea TaxID=41803 RepID=A0A9P0Z015_CUSEU|nr:unnamed protein product [Cuscuta europaea]